MSNLKFLRVFTLRSSSVWIINTIMFAKLNEWPKIHPTPPPLVSFALFVKLIALGLFEFENQPCGFILQRAYLIYSQCPFGRIIYMFEYKNAPFLRQLQSEITAVNAGALELDTLPQHVIEAALSTYKLSR